jgi:hypothetical protein
MAKFTKPPGKPQPDWMKREPVGRGKAAKGSKLPKREMPVIEAEGEMVTTEDMMPDGLKGDGGEEKRREQLERTSAEIREQVRTILGVSEEDLDGLLDSFDADAVAERIGRKTLEARLLKLKPLQREWWEAQREG